MTADWAFFAGAIDRIFTDLCSAEAVRQAEAEWPANLWDRFEQLGLTLVSIPEEQGGSGGSCQQALALLEVAGRHACPLPLAETAMLAGWILAEAGLAIPAGPMTIAMDPSIRFDQLPSGGRFAGHAEFVPWGRIAHIVIVAVAKDVAIVSTVEPSECTIEEQTNIAGEPRDMVRFETRRVSDQFHALPVDTIQRLEYRGALARTMMMAGALRRVLELSISHASDRVQFGRPIAKFQAIQHHLATMAGDVATSLAAAQALIQVADDPTDELIAAAKTTVSEAAGSVTALAHQIHGAIGITYEHRLHLFTRRLLAWRDEYGSESLWAARLGEQLLERGGAAELWPTLTSL